MRQPRGTKTNYHTLIDLDPHTLKDKSPAMDSESVVSQVQRKIELQSPDDLTYLIANVRRAAAERLNEAFPVVEGNDGEDEPRNQIETLVNEVKIPLL